MVTSGTYVILIADLRVTFKGSLPGPMFLYFIARYLGCRTRLRPKNLSVCVIFDRVECKMPNIFKCLKADVLGGRLGSEK